MSRFRRVSSEILFQVPWATFLRHTLEHDDGTPAPRPVLSFDTPDWVNVIALTADGRYVMVRQHRFGTQTDSLEIPGGLVDPGESPEDAAVRELREETGYAPASVRSLGWCHANPAIQSTRLHTFVATGCALAGAQALDDLEDCRVEILTVDAIRDAMRSGEISHALVRVAILEHLASSLSG